MTEQQQIIDTIKYFSNVLLTPLPPYKDGCGWILTENVVDGKFKPIATVLIHSNNIYIKKLIRLYGLKEKMEAYESYNFAGVSEYDFTAIIKIRRDIIAINKACYVSTTSKGEERIITQYSANIIPQNDPVCRDYIMRKANKDLMLLIQ